jgi:hypothetical protein
MMDHGVLNDIGQHWSSLSDVGLVNRPIKQAMEKCEPAIIGNGPANTKDR